MFVKNIFIYPIKGCQGISLDLAEVTTKGFAWDRELMVVDAKGKFLTQRDCPQLATIQVAINDNHLTLSKPNHDSFTWQPNFTGSRRSIEVWSYQGQAIDQGDRVATWLKKALGLTTEVHLVRQSPQHSRIANPKYTKRDDATVSFADAYPLLVTATASLEELNRRLEETYSDSNQQIPMNRFRPNIILETNTPFVESDWSTLQIGAIIFDLVKPCDRCIVTTTDQLTGERNNFKEPLKTLSKFRQFPGGIMFGENMVPRNVGTIKVGEQAFI